MPVDSPSPFQRSPTPTPRLDRLGVRETVTDIPGVLDQVPAPKRPRLNPELFDALAEWYPDWTVALCCFNTRLLRLGDPLVWWYEPMNPEQLFLPALDCHTGTVPDLNARVYVDHAVVVGSYRMSGGRRVYYSEEIPKPVAPYLLSELVGKRLEEYMPNGDFVCQLSDVIDGQFRPERKKPPGASTRGESPNLVRT